MSIIDWLYNRPLFTPTPVAPAKENKVAFKMTGVYQRRDMDFATQQDLERAKVFALTLAPFTIRTDPQLAAEYAAIYGQNELAELNNNNMVQSNNQGWVKGGVYVPAANRPDARVPGPDEEAVNTPFGTIIRKKAVSTASNPVAAISLDEMESMVDTVFMRDLKRVFPERF